MAVLGLVESWWALLALPAAILIGFAFAAVGLAATTFLRGWQDFEFVQLAVLPLFLFSTTFYPLSTYPRPLQVVVECTPLYHGIELRAAAGHRRRSAGRCSATPPTSPSWDSSAWRSAPAGCRPCC